MQNRLKICVVVAVAGVVTAGGLRAAMAQKPAEHTMMNAAELKWGPAPPSLPPGAQLAVLDGDPSKAGQPFSMRAKFPDGYRVPPHWHPTDERVVVIQGTFMMGIGDKVDMPSMHALTAGGFAKMPAKTNHYAAAKGETIIQIYGTGPFEVTYVNPSDDPRKKKSE
jgi:quercetin dioxygenase-like cupin family protein